MKKTSILICLTALSATLNAQGPSEALRVSQWSYEGTARTIAMGNAFTALGGDIGGIAVNPAASGVLRHSEFTLSPGGIFANGGGDCLGTSARDNAGRFVMSNAGLSLAFDTGLLSGLLNYNFSIAANRVADFNGVSAFSCTTGQSSLLGHLASDIAGVEESDLSWTDVYNPYFSSPIPWDALLAYDTYLISPRGYGNQYIGSTENEAPGRTVGGGLRQDYFSRSTGGIMQYAVNFGFNFSSKVFFGFNLNFHSVRYTKDETYSETADSTSGFDDGFGSFSSRYWQTTTGSGVNCKFGIIVTPVGGLRLGATITTPTAYRLYDVWGRNMSSDFTSKLDRYGNQRAARYTAISPEGAMRYRVTAPMQWSVGAAYTFGNVALLSFDFERVNYASARLYDDSGSGAEFKYENDIISRNFTACNIMRAGAEVRPMESLSIRAGYNRQSSAGTLGEYAYPALNYVSGGIGIRFGSDSRCSFDAAYQHLLRVADNYTMYADYEADGEFFAAPRVNGWSSKGKLVFTFTYRF